MNITKHEHACVVVEEQGKKLVIDPGVYAASLRDLSNIVAVVVTHIHPDHFDGELVQAIVAQNPGVKVFSTAQVAEALPAVPITAVTGGGAETVDPFSLNFVGEWHAPVHGDKPHDQNIGVVVNDRLYYPGDALTNPGVPVEILALPVGGPWLKLGEAMDLLAALKSKQCFGTHDVHLSDIGHEATNGWLERLSQELGIIYSYLKPGDSLSV